MQEILLLMQKYNKKPVSLSQVRKLKNGCKQFDEGLILPFERTAAKPVSWYYYPSLYTEKIYSSEGEGVTRESFDAKIDSGEAVQTGRDYVAFYPGDDLKYHVGIFTERTATDKELTTHYWNIKRKLEKIIVSHHYLTGQPEGYKQYLEQRLEKTGETIVNRDNKVYKEAA